jgi:hypothetical protein
MRLLRWHAHQYFRNISNPDIKPPANTPLTLAEVIENIWQNVDRNYYVGTLPQARVA